MVKNKLKDIRDLDAIEIYKLIINGQLKKFPDGYWINEKSDENSKKVIKYLIEEKLKWSDADVKKHLRKQVFKDNKLRGMLAIKFQDSPYKAINHTYKDKYNPWDFVNSPNKYWRGKDGDKNAIQAIKWLIEEKLQLDEEAICFQLKKDTFVKNNLEGMLKIVCKGSIYVALNKAYPGKFKRWQVGEHVSNNYWTKKKGAESIKWLIEKKLKLNQNEIKDIMCKQFFIDNNLGGMLQKCFDGSPYKALNFTYPDVFYAWEFRQVPKNFWTLKNSKKALDILIKNNNFDEKTALEKIDKDFLKEHGMGGASNFNIKEIIKEIYK